MLVVIFFLELHNNGMVPLIILGTAGFLIFSNMDKSDTKVELNSRPIIEQAGNPNGYSLGDTQITDSDMLDRAKNYKNYGHMDDIYHGEGENELNFFRKVNRQNDKKTMDSVREVDDRFNIGGYDRAKTDSGLPNVLPMEVSPYYRPPLMSIDSNFNERLLFN